ncbi:MAG: putative stress-responsive transcriptional regulator [Bacteroidetes bacterium]|nr:putative stress-responsive transcriptional regulator [Bacteroidota bacterium]
MKKTININLGGQPFIIDEPAFDILHKYFEALKLKFTNEGEQKEILSDIESRIAEIFTQRLAKSRAVVAEEDVTYVISLMGRPEDIAGESDTHNTGTEAPGAASAPYTGPVEKKFFRDPDNKKVGGVISGLCHYFGWGDPTWIRIILVAVFALSIFTPLNFSVPLAVIYLILLVVVPEANTSTEKLQMRGKPVTLQNIEKEVRDAMTTAGHSVNDMIKNNDVANRTMSTFLAIARVLGRIILIFVIFLCVVLMLALIASFFSLSIMSSASLTDYTHLLVSSHYTIMMFNVGLLLTLGIPLVSIMYDAIRFMTGSHVTNPILKRALWAGWFVGVILLSISLIQVVKSFAASDTIPEKVQLLAPSTGMLHVQMADSLGHALDLKNDDDEELSTFLHISGLSKNARGFAFKNLQMEIAVSPDTNFYVERVAFSKGANFADAEKNIQMMKYRFSQSDTILNLNDRFEIPAEGKWRAQHIKIRIYVPEGKRIAFASNMDQIDSWVKGNDYFDDGEVSDKILQVENGKIKCINCKEKMITDEDESGLPEPPEAPEAPMPPGGNFHMHVNSDSDNVTINMDEHGMVVKGKGKNNENIDIRINDKGLVKTRIDTNRNKK